jgi:hypothetical protein
MVPSLLEWLIVALGFAAGLYAVIAAVLLSVWPGEENDDHPKRLIFKENR